MEWFRWIIFYLGWAEFISISYADTDMFYEEVARKRKNHATQMGVDNRNYTAALALDGDSNQDINVGHCAFAYDASGQRAWWMVDLGSEHAIYTVTIFSPSGYGGYLGFISVRVSNSADISEHTVSDQCALWDEYFFPAASNQTLMCDQVMCGRYLSIQRTGGYRSDIMILCEVMVMGRQLEEVARRRKEYATQIRTVQNYTADLALDGDTSSDVNAGHCAWSYDVQSAVWWMVDLGSRHVIYSVTIYGRNYEHFPIYSSVRVGDTANISEHTDQCPTYDGYKARSQTLVCNPVMYGRYVSIQNFHTGFSRSLILCEVMVMGSELGADCTKCIDNSCVLTATCDECDGFEPPKCQEVCDSGTYGINCARSCSEGCKGTCDHVTGTCSCQRWWKGAMCSTEIRALEIPTDVPTASLLADSIVMIKWKKIVDHIPAELSYHYQYVIEYKEDAYEFVKWQQWHTRHLHDQYQEATLTGLMCNAVYDVRVKSYRVVGADREETGVTEELRFETNCKEAVEIPGESDSEGSFPVFAIGIIICCLLLVVLVVVVVFFLHKVKRLKQSNRTNQATAAETRGDAEYEDVGGLHVVADEPVSTTTVNPSLSESQYENPVFNPYVNEDVKPEYTELRTN